MKQILFVCIENANRSQMAEAFARKHGRDLIDPYSAGSRPSAKVNPRAVRFMREVGYDLSGHRSKSTKEVPPGPYAVVVTMGCGDECPFIPAQSREDWPLKDPRTLDDEGFREVRDEIKRRVLDLIERLQV